MSEDFDDAGYMGVELESRIKAHIKIFEDKELKLKERLETVRGRISSYKKQLSALNKYVSTPDVIIKVTDKVGLSWFKRIINKIVLFFRKF